MRIVFLALGFVGCGDLAAVGSADVCFLVSGSEGDILPLDVSGTLVAPTDTAPVDAAVVHPCADGPHRYVGVTDAEGVTWWAGYALADESGAPLESEYTLIDGAPATLRFRSIRSFGSAAGFVLTVDGAPAVAVENGGWGPALEDGDVPGLSVETGRVVARRHSKCGPQVFHALTLTGDDPLDVTPMAGAPLSVGGVPMFAWGVAAWDLDHTTCLDAAGTRIWALFPEH